MQALLFRRIIRSSINDKTIVSRKARGARREYLERAGVIACFFYLSFATKAPKHDPDRSGCTNFSNSNFTY
jgi:hypothetical protein